MVIRSAFSYPIPPGGEFGAPRPNGPHTGEDHAMPVGTPLPSLVAGSLADYELDPLGGHEARVTRPNGDVVIFAHCSGIVGPDRLVAQGDLIAYSGNSGTATTGPHVHVEVRVAGMAAPPGPYFHPMDEAEVRRLVRDEVERQYDLANTIAALKALTTKIVTALRALGNL